MVSLNVLALLKTLKYMLTFLDLTYYTVFIGRYSEYKMES
jgi:hypothetical protein